MSSSHSVNRCASLKLNWLVLTGSDLRDPLSSSKCTIEVRSRDGYALDGEQKLAGSSVSVSVSAGPEEPKLGLVG